MQANSLFLSTLSLRRATVLTRIDMGNNTDFYPRSPCGERPVQHSQIHKHNNFYPRSPCGERLPSVLHSFRPLQISIHALLAESDRLPRYLVGFYSHFYPRSPCGERLTSEVSERVPLAISIHALLAESDSRPALANSQT